MTIIKVCFPVGHPVNFIDGEDYVFNFEVVEGHLRVSESLRIIPGSAGNFKAPRCIHVYAPGAWREVQVDYGSYYGS